MLLALLLFPLLVVAAFLATLNLLPKLGDFGSSQGKLGGNPGLPGLNGSLSTTGVVHVASGAGFVWPDISIPGLSATLLAEVLLVLGVAFVLAVGVRRFKGSRPATPPFQGDDPLMAERQEVAAILDVARIAARFRSRVPGDRLEVLQVDLRGPREAVGGRRQDDDREGVHGSGL